MTQQTLTKEALTREKNRTVAQFLIDIPIDLVPEVAGFMDGLNVSFDPVGNMTSINSETVKTDVHYGHEVKELLGKINLYLEETGNEPRVPENHEEWTLLQTYEFLIMASNEFNWTNHMSIDYAWWENGGVWSELVKEYPNLFPRGELPVSQGQPEAPQTQKDVHYEIAIPLDQVAQVAEMLEAQGVEMDTVKDMLGVPPDNSGYRTRGTQVEEFLEDINSHLRGMDLSPLVPADHENWSMAMRSEFLNMAAFRFNWDEGGFVGTWWERDSKEENQETWNRITGDYPNLFR